MAIQIQFSPKSTALRRETKSTKHSGEPTFWSSSYPQCWEHDWCKAHAIRTCCLSNTGLAPASSSCFTSVLVLGQYRRVGGTQRPRRSDDRARRPHGGRRQLGGPLQQVSGNRVGGKFGRLLVVWSKLVCGLAVGGPACREPVKARRQTC